MTPKQAAAVFTQFGVSSAELASPAAMKAARNRLMKTKHTDHGQGNTDAAAYINAAYDVLKQLPDGYHEPEPEPAPYQGLPGNFFDRQLREAAPPRWQTDRGSANNSVIEENYSDANYVKQRLWELSGGSTDEYELFYYDGSFRRSISVFGASDIFPEMARAVIGWNGGARGFGHRAVFVRRRRNVDSLMLIHLDGRDLREPVAVRQDGFAVSPGKDLPFLQQLPALLAAVARTLRADA
jgi:hypothetical protein